MGILDKIKSRVKHQLQNRQEVSNDKEDTSSIPEVFETKFSGDFKTYENLPEGSKARITHHDKYEDTVSTREWCSLEVPAECGFDFSNVILQETKGVDNETGEIKREQAIVLLRDKNLKKNVNDFKEVMKVNHSIKELVPNWPEDKAAWLFELLEESVNGRVKIPKFNNEGTIRVMPLTPKGKVKKYPIGATIVMDVEDDIDISQKIGRLAGEYSHGIICHSSYLADGRIGRATLRINSRCKFYGAFLERSKDGEFYVKKVELREMIKEEGRTVITPWETLYKR